MAAEIDTTARLYSLALDAAMLRHQAIANNIANAGSPGYQRLQVNFEQQLEGARQAFASGQSKLPAAALEQVKPVLETVPGATSGSATAASRLDREMVDLARNTVHYEALLKVLGHLEAMHSTAINEGRR